MSMTHVHHHKNNRRKNKRHPTYIKFLDHLVMIVGVIVPFLSFIQSYKIWTTKSASGISLIAFVGYFCANIVWLSYGIAHKEKPLILMYILLMVANSTIILGALLY